MLVCVCVCACACACACVRVRVCACACWRVGAAWRVHSVLSWFLGPRTRAFLAPGASPLFSCLIGSHLSSSLTWPHARDTRVLTHVTHQCETLALHTYTPHIHTTHRHDTGTRHRHCDTTQAHDTDTGARRLACSSCSLLIALHTLSLCSSCSLLIALHNQSQTHTDTHRHTDIHTHDMHTYILSTPRTPRAHPAPGWSNSDGQTERRHEAKTERRL